LKLNSLLLWNEAEDVELAYWYSQLALPLRTNPHSAATTVGIKESYTRFTKFSEINNKKTALLVKEELRRIHWRVTRAEISEDVMRDYIWEDSSGGVKILRVSFLVRCFSGICFSRQPMTKLLYRIFISTLKIIKI
jgi:hypothetical protein